MSAQSLGAVAYAVCGAWSLASPRFKAVAECVLGAQPAPASAARATQRSPLALATELAHEPESGGPAALAC